MVEHIWLHRPTHGSANTSCQIYVVDYADFVDMHSVSKLEAFFGENFDK